MDHFFLEKTFINSAQNQKLLLKAAQLNQKGKHQQARTACAKLVKLNPKLTAAHRLLGAIYINLFLFEAAGKTLQQAIKLDPHDVTSYHLLANVLSERRQYKAADTLFQEISTRFPQHGIQLDWGRNLTLSGQIEDANEVYKKLLISEPNNLKAIYNLAQNQILLGNFEAGWPGYELRFAKDGNAEPVFQHSTKWQGEDLQGKSILVWREQGIGDEIQYSLCYPDIIAQAGKCFILCNPRLYSLFERSFPSATIIKFGELDIFLQENTIDFHIGAGSLMGYFRPSKESFKCEKNPLLLDNNMQNPWRHRLKQLPHPINIGISWEGGKKIEGGNDKSMPFDPFSSLFDIEGVNWIVLQHGNIQSEIQKARQLKQLTLHQFEDASPSGDIDPYAALINSLDLVVSTDSAVANIAGAIGTPTLALLSQSPSWTWTLGETFSLWYPQTKQIRRGISDNDWTRVIQSTQQEILYFITQGNLASRFL